MSSHTRARPGSGQPGSPEIYPGHTNIVAGSRVFRQSAPLGAQRTDTQQWIARLDAVVIHRTTDRADRQLSCSAPRTTGGRRGSVPCLGPTPAGFRGATTFNWEAWIGQKATQAQANSMACLAEPRDGTSASEPPSTSPKALCRDGAVTSFVECDGCRTEATREHGTAMFRYTGTSDISIHRETETLGNPHHRAACRPEHVLIWWLRNGSRGPSPITRNATQQAAGHCLAGLLPRVGVARTGGRGLLTPPPCSCSSASPTRTVVTR